MKPTPVIRMLGPDEASVLTNVAAEVFDQDVQPDLATAFLHDQRHHLAVALEGTLVIGMASAVHYIHPDKPAQLFINEVGVTPTHQRQGIGRQLIATLLEHGQALGCNEAWVCAEPDNEAARNLYSSAGGGNPEPFVLFSFRIDPKT
jgi:ribosomal protein S18 acetylase RimI-like enzyme